MIACAWCGAEATQQVEVESSIVRKRRVDGVLKEVVVAQPRFAPACDEHARARRAPESDLEKLRKRREARAWRARQTGMF